MLTSKRFLAMLLMVMTLMFSGMVPAHASGAVSSSDGITIRTQVHVTAEMIESSKSWLMAGLDQWLAIKWQMNESGWFPVWELILTSDAAPEIRLATAVPSPSRTYETVLSYDAGSGTVGVEVTDTVEQKPVLVGGAQISPNAQSARPVTDGRLLTVTSHYEPVGVRWDIGILEGASFLPGSVLEPNLPAQAKFILPGPTAGEYRLLSENNKARQVVASAPASQSEILANIQIERLPLGRSTLVLQYVNGTIVKEIERRQIVVGRVEAVVNTVETDFAQEKLNTKVVLHSDSKLSGVELTLHTRLVPMQWDSANKAYVDGQAIEQLLPIATDKWSAASEQSVPIALPLPKVKGLWRAEFNMTAQPEISLGLAMQSSYFTTGTGNARLADGRSVIRIGTYNILGFQGHPPDQAAKQLGSMFDPRRTEYFSQVISGLDTDILCIQEGASTYQLADYARRLGLNLAPFASSTSFPGGILTRFPVLETRPFHVGSWTGVIPYSRYGGAALLDVGGALIWVVSLHAYPHDEAIRKQEAVILGTEIDQLLKVTPHIIVGGDFNETVQGSLHQALRSRGFVNALQVTGGMQSIDHLYVSRSLVGYIRAGRAVTSAGFRLGAPGTGAWANSDHVPVLLELALP